MRCFNLRVTLIGLIVILMGNSLIAQEIQIPFCGKYPTITPPLAKKIGQFKGIEGFKEAFLYANPDSTYTIEVLYLKEGRIVRERRATSRVGLNDLCTEIDANTGTEYDDQRDFGRDGKRRLIGSSMTYSLGYYGWAVPVALEAEDGKAYAASYMFIGGAGFFVPFLATRNKEVTWGMAKGYAMGSGLGIAHGWALTVLMLGDEMDDGRAALGISVATSLTEGLIGYSIARKHNLNFSRMSMIGSGGTWGGLYGLALPYIIADPHEPRLYAFSTLAASGFGMFGGNYLYRKFSPSNGDVTIANTLGLLGAALPLSVMNYVADDEELGRTTASLMLLGSLAGLGYGLHKTSTVDYDNQQGNIVALGALAGYFTGLGTAYLAEGEPPSYMLMGVLGATAGFFVTDAIVSKDIKKTDGKQKASLSIDLNPYPLYGMVSRPGAPAPFNPHAIDYNYILKMRLQF